MIYKAAVAVLAALALAHSAAVAQVPQQQPPSFQPSQPVVPPGQQLDNNRTYQNSNGQTIHSPAHTMDNSAPPGATARCGDGTYSFSQHHQGTCSSHGGVATWL